MLRIIKKFLLDTDRMNIDRKFRAARIWSNEELKKYAKLFGGEIVNVSAWKDEDKQGGFYKEYFVNADSYSITNYGGTYGESGGEIDLPEYALDLTSPLPEFLSLKFDTVFNHTTLEHIYDNRLAFKNLCNMARDAVIVVVPWVQQVHIVEGAFNDYWRYSPYAMELLYNENGFDMVVCNWNNDFDSAVYLFCIGIRKDKREKYPGFEKVKVTNDIPAGRWIGTYRSRDRIVNVL